MLALQAFARFIGEYKDWSNVRLVLAGTFHFSVIGQILSNLLKL